MLENRTGKLQHNLCILTGFHAMSHRQDLLIKRAANQSILQTMVMFSGVPTGFDIILKAACQGHYRYSTTWATAVVISS